MATQTPLSVTYTSTTNPPFAISLPLTAPAVAPTVESKTKYLAALRQSAISLQEQVNRELTARMEEDKVQDASATTAAGVKAVDDEKEEENYGEEVQEED